MAGQNGNGKKRPPQIPEGGWPEVRLPATDKPANPASRSEKRDPCRFIMERLREQFGLEFIYAKLSERGRFKVMDHARLVLKWEEAGPRKVREIDRLLAKKSLGPQSQKIPRPEKAPGERGL